MFNSGLSVFFIKELLGGPLFGETCYPSLPHRPSTISLSLPPLSLSGSFPFHVP